MNATDPRTYEDPFSIRNETGNVSSVGLESEIDSSAVVGPRPELQRTELIIEGKPGYVDLAGAPEQTRWHPETITRRRNDDVSRERAVDIFVGTEDMRRRIDDLLTDSKVQMSKRCLKPNAGHQVFRESCVASEEFSHRVLSGDISPVASRAWREEGRGAAQVYFVEDKKDWKAEEFNSRRGNGTDLTQVKAVVQRVMVISDLYSVSRGDI